jgi:hypothetical protein
MDVQGILKAIALELRRELEGKYDAHGNWQPGDLERRLAAIGVRRDRSPIPVDELPYLSADDREARTVSDAFLQSHAEAGQSPEAAIAEFVRESAYTWANRLLALRCMEARGLIDEVILQKDAYGGRSLQHQRLARKEPERCSGEDEGLLAVLLDEFATRAKELSLLFDPKAPEVALRPSVVGLKRCVALLSGTLAAKGQEAATDDVFTAPDALGWAYQYWNTEEKDRVFEKVRTKKGAKIEGAEIVPATCIYTEPYMVKFLVQNSLGAMWMGMNPDSALCDGWEYYVRDADRAPASKKAVSDITFLDPACGSGHFLIEAFELFYAMYLEEGAITEPARICAAILERNLHGIDIDERAAQIAALALVMKAKEKAPDFVPRQVNLVSTNIRLPAGKEHLERFLRKHPEDAPLKPALLAIFEGLAHADDLGSLLQIEDPVDRELRDLRDQQLARERKAGAGTLFGPRKDEEWTAWKRDVIRRLREHFSSEAQETDLATAFFGEAAGKGLSLVDLLARRYDVVVANPPYMGSRNMGPVLKRHVGRHFPAGKRDLYASFLLCCLSLKSPSGMVGMVTQRGWLTQKHFTALRRGRVEANDIRIIANLGPRAFAGVSGENVTVALSVLGSPSHSDADGFWVKDVAAHQDSDHKARALTQSGWRLLPLAAISKLDNCQILVGLPIRLIELLAQEDKLRSQVEVEAGLWTGDDARFTRWVWEAPQRSYWKPLGKGGAYRRWAGLLQHAVRWENDGAPIKDLVCNKFPYLKGKYEWVIKNEASYFRAGAAYSFSASASLGVRTWPAGGIFSELAPFIKVDAADAAVVAGVLSTYPYTAMLRAIADKLRFRADYVNELPAIPNALWSSALLREAAQLCVRVVRRRIEGDPTERDFSPERLSVVGAPRLPEVALDAVRLAIQGVFETRVRTELGLSAEDEEFLRSAIGPHTGGARIAGYESLELPLPEGYQISADILSELRLVSVRDVSTGEMADIRKRLREWYEAGPGAKMELEDAEVLATEGDDETEDQDEVDARIPVPSETFLEELSQKLEIHPISIYWLLHELREKEGVVCEAELVRFNEDYVSVLVLRVLGHRSPRELESGAPPPTWADWDGIIPISDGMGEAPLAARIRDRIAEDFGLDRVGAIEREFGDIVGKSLSEWLTGDFFKRHISQFKKRPIAWQIESTPGANGKHQGRSSARKAPAFSCLVYYHRLDADLLPKLRTQYAGPLRTSLQTELGGLEKLKNRTAGQDARRFELEEKIEELTAFDDLLEQVSAEGFVSTVLDAFASMEPLDRWTSLTGRGPVPSSRDAFLVQERKYAPDLNDGVRVNIAPLQRAELLAADVLAAKDLEKAIADRAEWRADERRWCREGKLPRPGWWPSKDGEA